jgi:LuxR family quorum-sensing system transcriptional regulator SolR
MKLQKDYIQASNEIKEICAPFLSALNLTMFAYSRVFNDGSRAELWTDIKPLEHSFIDKKYINDVYTPNIYSENDKYVFLPYKVDFLSDKTLKQKYQNQLFDQRNIFGNDNCFNIVRKSENMCEYFIFYTSREFRDPVNFYLNKIVILDEFVNSFKIQASSCIKIADDNKIVQLKNEPFAKLNTIFNPISSNQTNELQVIFTKRELQICKDVINGKTASESAIFLGLKTRSIEKYIERIKNKVDCNRKTELAIKLIKLGLL